MTKYFLYTPSNCILFSSEISKTCLPTIIDCDFKDTFVVECGTEFNCSQCCDVVIPFFLPVVEGDEIIIQTQIFDQYNDNRKIPVSGFGTWIKVYTVEEDGTETEINPANYAAYVGWNGTNSYQVININYSTDYMPLCFQIKFKVYLAGDVFDYELCSQHYKIETCADVSSCVFEGKQTGTDCEGNYYDLPEASDGLPFEYSNKIRIPCYEQEAAPVITETVKSNRIVNKEIKYRTEIKLQGIPLYLVKYLENRVFLRDNVYKDGKIIQYESGILEQIEGTCLYNYSKYIITSCEVKNC